MDKIRTHLTCPKCNKLFNTKERQPFALQCGDTFCLSCLQEAQKRQEFNCFFDSKSFDLNDYSMNKKLYDLINSNILGFLCETHDEKIKFFSPCDHKFICIGCLHQIKGSIEKSLVFDFSEKEFFAEIEEIKEKLVKMRSETEECIEKLEKIINYQENYDPNAEILPLIEKSYQMLLEKFCNEDLSKLKSWRIYEGKIIEQKDFDWIFEKGFKDLFGKNIQKFELVFKASLNGFASADYHKICDGKSNCLVVCKNDENFVFGGFINNKINSNGSYESSANNEAFLFSVNRKSFHRIYQNHGNALYQSSGYGPTWGGHDLYISSNCNVNQDSFCNLGHTYQTSNNHSYGSKEAKDWLAGKYKFTVKDYEVYQLTFK